MNVSQAPNVVKESGSTAVFRTYAESEFIRWPSWVELERILQTNGGAYGLSGPRGAGKTWLIWHATTRAENRGGIGLWFPSPSDYEAISFVGALADAFADAVQRRYRWDGVRLYEVFGSWWAVLISISLIAAAYASVLLSNRAISESRYFEQNLEEARYEQNQILLDQLRSAGNDLSEARIKYLDNRDHPEASSDDLAMLSTELEDARQKQQVALDAYSQSLQSVSPKTSTQSFLSLPLLFAQISGIGGLVGILLAPFALWRTKRPSIKLCKLAERLRNRIRFSESRVNSSEVGLAGGAKGLLKKFSQREFVERPFTLTSLMQDFRVLLSQTAVTVKAPIVLGIDELDKLHDPEIARELLRDVKGIFEVAGVHFLVSISLEAQENLALGAVKSRDEFHSSFYKVLELGVRTPEECMALVAARDSKFPSTLR